MDEVQVVFVAAHKHGRIVAQGHPGARFLASLEPGWIFLLADGEPDIGDFEIVLAEASNLGHFRGEVSVLLDLTLFTGAVDWGTINRVKNGVDWNSVGGLNIAYIVRDMQFAPLAKIASVIFSAARHEVFQSEPAALDWLRSQRA